MRRTVLTRGKTRHNRAHLPAFFLADVEAAYAGTRLGRQELDGELFDDIEGSLWPRALIEARRVRMAPYLRRTVIGVDPPAGAGSGSDACGIVAAGIAASGKCYVLDDASVQGVRPEAWARAVVRAHEYWDADRVVVETNQGGAMVDAVLRGVDRRVPVRAAWAGRGKSARAEPVAAAYERGEVFHVRAFAALEDEMAGMTIAGNYEGPGRSPDRADALVWALTELLWGGGGEPGVRSI